MSTITTSPSTSDMIPRIFQKKENTLCVDPQPTSSLGHVASFGGSSERPATSLAVITEADHIPVPQIAVEDDEEGYIFDRPNRTRVRTGSDDEDSGGNPSKRPRIQGPEESIVSHPSETTSRIHIKHSGGRRTFGLSRGR
jgi:hypothetical protein